MSQMGLVHVFLVGLPRFMVPKIKVCSRISTLNRHDFILFTHLFATFKAEIKMFETRFFVMCPYLPSCSRPCHVEAKGIPRPAEIRENQSQWIMILCFVIILADLWVRVVSDLSHKLKRMDSCSLLSYSYLPKCRPSVRSGNDVSGERVITWSYHVYDELWDSLGSYSIEITVSLLQLGRHLVLSLFLGLILWAAEKSEGHSPN